MNSVNRQLNRIGGFTLLELMVAMVLLSIALSIAFQAFAGTLRAWKRGSEVLNGITHGDFAMNQLVRALNSTIYFKNEKKIYAFQIEKRNSSGQATDEISFVTASGAFMPPHSPFSKGPHRVEIFIQDDETGTPALFARAMPAIPPADAEELSPSLQTDPLLISRTVQGLEILIWDEENEDWTEEWEQENAIPERILITLLVASENENDEPIEFVRMVEIPVAKSTLSKPSRGEKK